MSSQDGLRRSSRRARVDAPAESTAPSRMHTSSTLYKAPHNEPEVPPDILELRRIVKAMDRFSFNQQWLPFLEKYQEVMDHYHPGLMNVCPTPITWKDHHSQNHLGPRFPALNFDSMLTLRRWIDTDAARGHKFSLAVMTTPTLNPVNCSAEEYRHQLFHAWVLMTAHAPEGTNGKTLITYDTDVEDFHNYSRETRALGFEHAYVQFIRRTRASRARERVWQNVPVPGGKPGEGDCYEFTMRWLMELVDEGLPSEHANGGLVSLKGFRQIRL